MDLHYLTFVLECGDHILVQEMNNYCSATSFRSTFYQALFYYQLSNLKGKELGTVNLDIFQIVDAWYYNQQ